MLGRLEVLSEVLRRTVLEIVENLPKSINGEKLTLALERILNVQDLRFEDVGTILETLAPELYTEPPRSKFPTSKPPGSPEKIWILQRRASLGCSLFREGDDHNGPS